MRSKIFAHYDEIETAVKNHTKTPSFTAKSKAKAKTIELKWNGKNYSADLTDSNKVLANYDFSASGLSFKKSGNVLTVTAEKAPKDEVLVTVDKKNGSRKGVITWTDEKIGPQTGQLQDIVTYGADVSDPVKAYFNIKVSTGNCEILKTSEDGKVDNIKFNFKGNGIDKDVVTDSKGRIFIDNIPAGVYTVTEYPIDRYVTPKSQTVTIIGGQTSTVHFSNILKKFRVKVVKSDIEKGKAQGDAKLSGAKYDDIQLSREGSIKITTEDVEGQCISCGSTACKYDVTIGNRSFMMCKKCFEKFCENVMNTPAVRELFGPKFKEFRKMVQEEITQSENDRIVNNVFIPKDRVRVYSFVLNKFGAQNIDKFSYIPVHGIKCNFCDEESQSDAKVVLGTNREHNILALAYCPECAKQINRILQRSIENEKTIYNKEKQIRCMVKSKFPQANYCYICGNKEGPAFSITHGNCAFSLCEKCVKKYANQLKSISEVE